MADKNLHDIKIDDLESSKKTPLKNLLTLLALLFIILVISVVITKLILNTDDENIMDESNISTTEINANETNNGALAATGAAIAGATGAVIAGTHNAATTATDVVKNSANNIKDGVKDTLKDRSSDAEDTKKDDTKDLSSSTLKEKNLTGSKTKVTLRDHRPESAVKELVSSKSSTKKDTTSSKKKTPSKKSSSHSTSSKHITSTHKRVSDRVVAKKSSTHHKSTSSKKHTVAKSIVGYTLTPGYYIKIGTFRDTSAAVNKIKKTRLNYKLIKVKDDKTLTRVFIGTFSSKANAKKNLAKAKKISSGAYIIKK